MYDLRMRAQLLCYANERERAFIKYVEKIPVACNICHVKCIPMTACSRQTRLKLANTAKNRNTLAAISIHSPNSRFYRLHVFVFFPLLSTIPQP